MPLANESEDCDSICVGVRQANLRESEGDREPTEPTGEPMTAHIVASSSSKLELDRGLADRLDATPGVKAKLGVGASRASGIEGEGGAMTAFAATPERQSESPKPQPPKV